MKFPRFETERTYLPDIGIGGADVTSSINGGGGKRNGRNLPMNDFQIHSPQPPHLSSENKANSEKILQQQQMNLIILQSSATTATDNDEQLIRLEEEETNDEAHLKILLASEENWSFNSSMSEAGTENNSNSRSLEKPNKTVVKNFK